MMQDDHPWEIIGHAWAVRYLRTALSRGRSAHAYLFAGPPAIGKGLLALRLAQALLCDTGGPDPCLQCRACRRVAHGNHPDARWVSLATQADDEQQETASRELKIGTIRAWQRDIDLRPFEAQRRVFVLDDAQALTDAAANAMLKTLEEPPAYATLILIAQGAGELLPTVVSRCRVLRLRPVPRALIAQALQARYGLAADDAALIAAWSGGRIGWALRAVAEPELLEHQQQRLAALIALSMAGPLERVRWAEERAREYREQPATALEWLALWQSWWRDVLLVRSGVATAITHLDRRAELQELAQHLSLDAVQTFLRRLEAAQQQLADNVNPQLVFENVALHVPGP
ncbi:DNA polymerase III subunit delta' [Kallotenue papyrolyticum]|uniref:DNA polymerase III subunit delta' n=1 Tax=Kallotenue papyrolyticum TaxID=1325125 RepID=UPI000492387C|nr:DNA polymerase III subunit delta' [Kallotenue papyrolyticum]